MNPETARDDVLALSPGAAVVYDAPLALETRPRATSSATAFAFDAIVEPVTAEPKLRKLLRNMAYVGVLARLLGIEMGEVEHAIAKQFGKKPKARDLNVAAARAGFEHAGHDREARSARTSAGMDATGGQDHRRRQRRGRDGRALRGRHRRHLVPHHAVVLARRDAHRLPASKYRIDADGKATLRGRAGGGRARRGRNGDRRRLGGRAGDDRDRAARASRS